MEHYKFIVIEDMWILRDSIADHLRQNVPGCEIVKVEVKQVTTLWKQIPEDLTGWTVFLDYNLGDHWERGTAYLKDLQKKGAHVLCISDQEQMVPEADCFRRKSCLDIPDERTCSAAEFRTFVHERARAA